MTMYRRTFAEINLDHIVHNFEVVKNSFPPNSFICPMVKANAYGHGDVAVSRCLEKAGAKYLGVCLIEEGLLLRRGGVTADILVFRGFDREGAECMVENRLTPVVSSWEQMEAIQSVAHKPVQIHLKFNTGMNRLGFLERDGQRLFEMCWQNPRVRVQGLLTHLYRGEDSLAEQGDSARQLLMLERIAKIFKPLNPVVHSLSSAGILNALVLRQNPIPDHPLCRLDWGLRPGLMIYGYNPLKESASLSLKPVMTLKSVTSTYRQLQKGEVVSYGGTWKAPDASVIAVVPIGYADGYHRILSNKASALFAGQRVPVVGTVCMDYLMLDITAVVKNRNIQDLGDQEIILFGQETSGSVLSAEELAKHAQTIPWEILTSVGERVPRIYVGDWAKKIGVAS